MLSSNANLSVPNTAPSILLSHSMAMAFIKRVKDFAIKYIRISTPNKMIQKEITGRYFESQPQCSFAKPDTNSENFIAAQIPTTNEMMVASSTTNPFVIPL